MSHNIWAKKFLPVSEPRLNNSGFPGGSASTWWLACRPEMIASAIVATLNGKAEPIVESAEADFSTLGIQLRGYHDFGVAMSEHRASVKVVASE